MTGATSTYRSYVGEDGEYLGPVKAGRPPPPEAVAIRTTINEIIHRDGTESLLDEWTTLLEVKRET